LNRAVVAFNDASLRPRQTVFDPRKARAIFTIEVDTSTDASSILHTRNGLYEVVDSDYSRHNFSLKAQAVQNFDLRPVLATVDDADTEKLRGIVLEIRSDTKRASALLGIADLMLRNLRRSASCEKHE
jgi:hypothetical protein